MKNSPAARQKVEGAMPPHSPSALGWGPHQCTADAALHGTRGNKQVVVVDFSTYKTSSLVAAHSFFCSLSLICGVVELKMNQGTVLEICDEPAPEKEGQRELGLQESLK